MITVLQLFWSFMQIGFTSFGGLSMIPLINSEMIGHGWMTATEVSDIVAIAEMTPGPLGLNCATFAGIRVAGVLGAPAAVFFEKFKKSRVLGDVMQAVRPVCVGLIWAVIIDLCRTNYIVSGSVEIVGVLIAALGVYLIFRWKWSVPKVICVAAVLGMIFCR